MQNLGRFNVSGIVVGGFGFVWGKFVTTISDVWCSRRGVVLTYRLYQLLVCLMCMIYDFFYVVMAFGLHK